MSYITAAFLPIVFLVDVFHVYTCSFSFYTLLVSFYLVYLQENRSLAGRVKNLSTPSVSWVD
jgi:hypothetical protein